MEGIFENMRVSLKIKSVNDIRYLDKECLHVLITWLKSKYTPAGYAFSNYGNSMSDVEWDSFESDFIEFSKTVSGYIFVVDIIDDYGGTRRVYFENGVKIAKYDESTIVTPYKCVKRLINKEL